MQQFSNPVYRPVCNNVKHMVKIMFWIDSVQFARPDKAVQQRAALTTMVRAEEQIVFTPQTDHPQSILRDVVIRFMRRQ
ncbi:Uncharacterised protein [Raoultella terrigena]|uniref:Uncharacterized protein n=1 Tax=Raoultella terrigena TaxID=577 RepID=A0A3P8M387_RAOTE|nr:Uncharacterised protein [Raoultella terrigena]